MTEEINTVKSFLEGCYSRISNVDYTLVESVLHDDFVFDDDNGHHDKSSYIYAFLPAWEALVSTSRLRIVSIALCTEKIDGRSVVLAQWECDYSCKEGAMWAGVIPISGEKYGLKVLASFHLLDGKIIRLLQRADDYYRHCGIEREVRRYMIAQEDKAKTLTERNPSVCE
mmetsp:Transcript_23017/g.33674  ORF Transcript_23017/g.33674 Transcript_23017/m.33674 type:complete len:170 (-) Transcript_23017:418-927(-)|eukprot:CAMPEP_0185033344 /NCGR_PEP_ID=MMETSP1103-20130426/22179_1 /TAXON_ID=36769 /ORGANISM="Paraphysomonas bandaiensis, Strain Caron Lab Isolate" /LENGTH=169 /DNA_ID=CAMNT_0027569571 /DNA_START=117 /DNA_END=626 /DNA_ORIENTATION=+